MGIETYTIKCFLELEMFIIVVPLGDSMSSWIALHVEEIARCLRKSSEECRVVRTPDLW